MITVKKQRPAGRQQTRCTPEIRARLRDWIEREITFVEHPMFAEGDFERQLKGRRPQSLDRTVEPAGSERGLAFISPMVETPLLTPDEEQYLFTWMNYLKFRAEQLRQKLNLNCPDASLIDRIESDLRDATDVRNRIVRSNLRLVVALAHKVSASIDQMGELIGEATVPLIRAVELFDVGLGNRFSTYATWAVRNHMSRCLKRRQTTQERIVPHDQLWLDRLPDERSNPDEEARLTNQRADAVQQLLMTLNERERMVITARFGLDGQPRGQSLQDIADRVGLSKERVRQIALAAIEKLQGIAKTTGSVM
ncbi:MAG: sigma-70 family RNA polymerase sigma factor [Planctomycetes bacterium]|nr:sigma-70 family RNA polymerase sigma factor [Planctomycetota bacterium]